MTAVSKHKNANVALCYIRQSQTRDENDTNSPERQRDNILLVCKRNHWEPEWYTDAEGHKSGREIKNRPGWLALQARLGDPDVVALVANDLSRLHRKGWRVGNMLEHLEKHNVALVLAAPGREVDTATPTGKMFIQFTAMLDQYYAEDISQRAKDSAEYRRRQGKAIGIPPYGTVKKDGFLIPSPEGAWQLPTGKFISGTPDQSPEEAAIWRSYFDGVRRILTLYAENQLGIERIAYQMNEEGFPFRDRNGVPRPMNGDDIRRIVGNWDKYGGIMTQARSKDRKAYEMGDSEDIQFNEERAVLPIDLLRKVAEVRKTRTVKPVDNGQKKEKIHFYPLSNITYCAHCERLAREQDDPQLRSTLSGTKMNGIFRYRHKPGVKCGCTNRSVPEEDVLADFEKLIKQLSVDENTLNLMIEMAIQIDQNWNTSNDNFDQQRTEAIALAKRKINAAVNLYSDGVIDREDYLSRREQLEREIAHWEARNSDTQKLALEFGMCMEAVRSIETLWDSADDEDKQGMVRNLFSYIVYDLDYRRIVDFRLKPWADRFLILRAERHAEESKDAPPIQEVKRPMPPTRLILNMQLLPQRFVPHQNTRNFRLSRAS
jgi:DNA invertase Pin-like site-specific DNA recombinase